jgi:hypothetical protein
MNDSLEERKRADLEPEKRKIEKIVGDLIRQTTRPTNRQKYFLRQALGNARRGLFQLARSGTHPFPIRPRDKPDYHVEGHQDQLGG